MLEKDARSKALKSSLLHCKSHVKKHSSLLPGMTLNLLSNKIIETCSRALLCSAISLEILE